MKLWTQFAVYAVAMFLTLACGSNGNPLAPSQPPAGPATVASFTVYGYVFDGTDENSRKPIAGVRVIVDGAYQAVTDDNGYYRIDRIAGPVCELEAVKEGYLSASTIISLDAKELRVDFDLKKR